MSNSFHITHCHWTHYYSNKYWLVQLQHLHSDIQSFIFGNNSQYFSFILVRLGAISTTSHQRQQDKSVRWLMPPTGVDIEMVEAYKYLYKLDWLDNTDVLHKKGQSRPGDWGPLECLRLCSNSMQSSGQKKIQTGQEGQLCLRLPLDSIQEMGEQLLLPLAWDLGGLK